MTDEKKPEHPERTGLTEAQTKKFIEWVHTKQPGEIVCPVCKSTKWVAGELVLMPPTMNPSGGYNLGGATYPLLPIFCTNCAHALFFNAIAIGVVEGSKKEEAEKK